VPDALVTVVRDDPHAASASAQAAAFSGMSTRRLTEWELTAALPVPAGPI
jgi:hypothetical protein